MPQKGTGDPLLKGRDWDAIRAHWIHLRQPCARCGREIDYTRGSTSRNALDVGHIVSRDQAKARGWTRREINSISNTQPECRKCNRSAGATYVNVKKGNRPIECDDW